MPTNKAVTAEKKTRIDIVGTDMTRLQEWLKQLSERCLKLVDSITYDGHRELTEGEALLVRMAQYEQIKAIINDALPFYLANGRNEFIKFIDDNVFNTVVEC